MVEKLGWQVGCKLNVAIYIISAYDKKKKIRQYGVSYLWAVSWNMNFIYLMKA